MQWIIAAGSDIGHRDEQQDRYLVVSSQDNAKHLLVVADGAGGHKAGALAAQTAIDCIRENLAALWSTDDPESYLNKLIVKCNERVLTIGDGELACATLVMAFVKHDEIFFGHVGDSRLYLVRDGRVIFKTTDHSIVELQRQQGARGVDALAGAVSTGLYMCLGVLNDIIPVVTSSLAREGDALLLCSDGFWGQIDMTKVATQFSHTPLTIERLNQWVAMAKVSKPNGSDNITAIAATFISQPSLFSSLLAAIVNLFKK